ncbi:hypothetical protein AVEN_28005-1 [Araneus ventricosus]|uniref:Uncharacterized protein n=1 Tax=Araneus ventricosus TaxID=182803 RepID=A0A4Y2BG05_ARAVE|nr:hypothetical protein AVEN_28005-1 [Araneus ventricosus]
MSILRNNYKQCNNRDDEDELFEVRSDFRTPGRATGKERCRFCTEHIAIVIVVLLLLAALAITAIIVIIYLPNIMGKRTGSGFNEDSDRLNPIAQTNCGAFVGTEEGGSYVFKLIDLPILDAGHQRSLRNKEKKSKKRQLEMRPNLKYSRKGNSSNRDP